MSPCRKLATTSLTGHLDTEAGTDIDGGGDAGGGGKSTPKRLFLDSIILCFLIFSAVALLSKLGCRLLSMRVTGATLFEKLKVQPRLPSTDFSGVSLPVSLIDG